MQKNNITPLFLLAFLFLVLGLAYYFFVARSQSKQSANNNNQTQEVNKIVEQGPVNDLGIEVPEGAQFYEASSFEISYKVNKMFFNKPTQEVIGKAQNVLAAGWLKESAKEGYVKVLLRFSDFKTDNEKRDLDTLDMLFKGNDQIMVEGYFSNIEIVPEEPVRSSGVFKVTLNGVSKEVPISYEIMASGDLFKAKGNGAIKLSDFNLKAPSLANVFEVGDEVMLEFSLQAVRSSESKSNS